MNNLKKISIFNVLFSCLFFIQSAAQKQGQARIDSLNSILLGTKIPDTVLINTLNIIAWELRNKKPDSSVFFGEKALRLANNLFENVKDDEMRFKAKIYAARSEHILGVFADNKTDYPLAFDHYFKSVDIWEFLLKEITASTSPYKKYLNMVLSSKAATFTNIGRVYQRKSNYPEALQYQFNSLKINEKLMDKRGMASSYTNIGVILRNQGNHPKALEYFLKALQLLEEFNDKEKIGAALGNIGIIFWAESEYPKALEYFFRSLKMFREVGNRNGEATVFTNVGLVYKDEGDKSILKGDTSYAFNDRYAKALENYFEGLKMANELGNKELQATNLGNIGVVYLDKQAYDKALESLFKALKIAEEMDTKNLISSNKTNIGYVYLKKNMLTEAETFLNEALSIANSIGQADLIKECNDKLSELYRKKNNWEKAFQHYSNAVSARDSLFSKEKAREITQKEMQFEFDKKELVAKTEYDKQIGISEADKKRGIAEADKKRIMIEFSKALELAEANKKFTEVEADRIIELALADKKRLVAEADRKAIKIKSEKQIVSANAENERQKLLRNAISLASIILILSSFFIFIFYKRKRDAVQKQKETALSLQVSETEMKALRSQMNPHFIFNALQSIQTFLLSHKSEEANAYLLKFSKLMRLVLENSQHTEVPLKEDIQALELYMQLESIRLQHPFTYHFHIDKSIDEENDSIPPLILQPFVENAIWHGLQYKQGPGHIDISISKKNNALYATVEDDGVGRDMSKQVTQPMLLKKESLGMKLTEERLKILNEVKNVKASFEITDLYTHENKPSGTKVELSLPLAS